MTGFICVACGTQFAATEAPPALCAICQDPRQFVPPSGQQWTTLERLRAGYRNVWQECESGLLGIGTVPEFAIGQRALLLRTVQGNFLWDCISLLDRATIALIRSLGGLRGIAISHPHYYSTVVEWSRAFDDAPIHLHEADQEWVMRPDSAIQFWTGEQKDLAPGIRLIRCGGHFPGGTILHWRGGAEGRGALLTGDILQVTPDGMVSFMFSYPNLTPLSATAAQLIGQKVTPLSFDRIYGAFWDRVIRAGGPETVRRSVARYLAAIDSSGSSSGSERTLRD
jgi:glyoxylase-like metal-dependent hydrolase (beta-lactamase superfamily II)